jgi:hypothetical protein
VFIRNQKSEGGTHSRKSGGLALRTTSRCFHCNIFGVSLPTAVEQHSPPPDHLPRLHPSQDVPHITFKMTKRTKKVGVTYVSPSRRYESSARANSCTAVNTVPGKLSRRNPMPEAFRKRLFPSVQICCDFSAVRGSVSCVDDCLASKRCTVNSINSTKRLQWDTTRAGQGQHETDQQNRFAHGWIYSWDHGN